MPDSRFDSTILRLTRMPLEQMRPLIRYLWRKPLGVSGQLRLERLQAGSGKLVDPNVVEPLIEDGLSTDLRVICAELGVG